MHPFTHAHRLRAAATHLSVLAACLAAVTAAADDYAVTPSADAFVSSTSHDKNYGAAGAIAVSASGLPKGEFQSVIRFDAGAIKTHFDDQYGAGNWTIDDITLRLTASTPGNKIFNSSAAGKIAASWMENDSWEEGTGNPNNPGTSGITFDSLSNFFGSNDEDLGKFDFDGSTSGNFTLDLSLTTSFSTDIANGDLVSLRLLAADSAVSGNFRAREFTNQSQWPVLTVSAVPEPATLGLFAIALLLLRRTRS